MPNEAADALAALYPALRRFAEKQLRTRHLDHQLAGDLVQEACLSWVVSGTELDSPGRLGAWLRVAIIHRAENLRRRHVRHVDALDHDPLSLDEQIEEE